MLTLDAKTISSYEVSPDKLYRRCDPAGFTFETTAELKQVNGAIGQARAVKAIRLGMGIAQDGFNIFALGPAGIGKRFLVEKEIAEMAVQQKAPDDLCYVNNFLDSQKPKAIHLAAGQAYTFRDDMAALIEEISTALPEAFEGEGYQSQRQALDNEFQEKPDRDFDAIESEATAKGFKMMSTPLGIVFAPLIDGKVIAPETYKNLPEEKQSQLQKDTEQLQEALQKVLVQVSRYKRELQDKIRELNREITDNAVGHLIKDVQDKYDIYPEIIDYLAAVEKDITEHTSDFVKAHKEAQASPLPGSSNQKSFMRRYKVNVVLSNLAEGTAPIIYEDNPTYENLVGRIEHIAQMGTLVTDFNLIKAGALHKANGGYLILDARKILQQAYAWEGLKRALKARRIRIESLGQALSLISTVSLEPEEVSLSAKLILLGDRLLYYLLCAYDPEFEELFKVAADFDETLNRTPAEQQTYAQLLASLTEQAALKPLDRNAVARVLEHGSRLVGDAQKLSCNMTKLSDLLCEANYYAEQAKREHIAVQDVEQAIAEQRYRAGRLRDRVLETTLRDIQLVATQGEVVGQINALSVLDIGTSRFGHPSRITARVRLGKGEVVDIEREVEMGGPIHSKGVMILASFLGAQYAQVRPLALKASLVFEQNYAGVDGDSASCAELCALLSAIGQIPLKQSLAITGSMNQYGLAQAIGGVNEKIEGFYDLCKERGLTGEQGVLIPESNLQHLMLRSDVVKSVKENMFHIYSFSTVEEALMLLSGLDIGQKDNKGQFEKGSLNALVEAKLESMTQVQFELARQTRGEVAHDAQA